MRKIYLCYLLLVLFACKKKEENSTNKFIPQVAQQEKVNYHVDTTYKYEYRIRSSGDYQYNYDVSGTDENSEEVSGNINIEGKQGSGSITDLNGNEIQVEVEWTGYGKLIATDKNGAEYELEVD